MRMRKHIALMLAATVATGTFVVAQEQKPVDTTTPAERAVERTLDKAERTVERADDKVEKAADRAGEKIENAADRVGNKVEKATDRASDKPQADAKPLAFPAGITAKELNEQGDIRNAFEAITEGSMSSDAFDNIVNRLVDADRDRIAKFKESKPDMKPLNDRISTLRRMWKDKYGKEFDLDEKVVFGANGYVAIAEGEISNPAQVVGNWPVPAQVGSSAMPAAANKPGINATEQATEASKVAGGDANIDKGRNVAVARYPAGHGLPAIDASLTHELPDIWRFDVPDTLDGQKLAANLTAQLNALGDGKNWPDDINEAYRIVGHRVLMAIYDVQPSNAEQRPQ